MPIPLAIPIALAVAGVALKAKSDRDANQRQRRLQEAMEAYGLSKAAEGRAATEQLIATQTPAMRDAQMAEVENERREDMQSSVDSLQAFNQPQLAGKLSPDYTRAQERSAETVSARTRRAIEQLATIGAPAEAGFRHNIRYGRAASGVEAATRARANVDDAYTRDIRGVRPSWRQNLASQLLIGLGQGMAARGGGGGGGVDV